MIAANFLSSTPVQLAWRGQATGRLLLNLCENAVATVFFLSSPLRNVASLRLLASVKIAPICINRLFRHLAPRPPIQSP